MNKIIYLLVVIVMTSCLEEKMEQVPLIEGRIENCSQKEIFLYNDEDSSLAIDTIDIDGEGFFKVPKASIGDIGFYKLSFNDDEEILFFLKPTDFISFQFDQNNMTATCKSNNSKICNGIWDLKRNTALFAKEFSNLSQQLKQMSNLTHNDSLYSNLHFRRDSLIKLYREKSLGISEKANSPVVYFLMLNQKEGNTSLFSVQDDLDLFLANAEILMKDEQLKRLFAVYDQSLMKAYSAIRAEQRYQSGCRFPVLKARTNWGEEMSLEKINGNPLHVILWSGVDLNDAQKIKEIKSLNLRYRSQGLKTLMVAYQKDKEVWLNSIKQNKLPFWHLIDTVALTSGDLTEMGVTSIPCNFIVDTTGVIINRDVWGKDLEEIMRRYFKKY